MKILIPMPPEYASIQQACEQQIERALNTENAGGRPEYDAGYQAATLELAETIEQAVNSEVAARRRPKAREAVEAS